MIQKRLIRWTGFALAAASMAGVPALLASEPESEGVIELENISPVRLAEIVATASRFESGLWEVRSTLVDHSIERFADDSSQDTGRVDFLMRSLSDRFAWTPPARICLRMRQDGQNPDSLPLFGNFDPNACTVERFRFDRGHVEATYFCPGTDGDSALRSYQRADYASTRIQGEVRTEGTLEVGRDRKIVVTVGMTMARISDCPEEAAPN